MSRYSDQLTDDNSRPLPGASVYVYDNEGDLAVLTDDDDIPLDNPVMTDTFGNYEFNAPDGFYTLRYVYGGRTRYERAGVPVGPSLPAQVARALLVPEGETPPAFLGEDDRTPGKVLGFDADRDFVALTLGGADGALRTDLAAGMGSSLVGALRSGTGAVSESVRTALDRLPVYPEQFGAGVTGDDTAALRLAAAFAKATAGYIQLRPLTTYWYSSYIECDGIDIRGPRSAVVKQKPQIVTTLTAGISSGTGVKVLSVANCEGFAERQSVILVSETAHTVSPSDPFNHRGRQILAVSASSGPGTITLAAGPSIGAHVVGDKLATSAIGFVQMGNSTLEGFTIDGNESSHLYASWITSCPVVQEGDSCARVRLRIQNTSSDAVLCGGPVDGMVTGCRDIDCEFENIGGNPIHHGNAEDLPIRGCTFTDFNMRAADPYEQGGGAGIRAGHQDGGVSESDTTAGLSVIGCKFRNGLGGIAALGTSPEGTHNDNVHSIGNEFFNCGHNIEMGGSAKNLISIGDRMESDPATTRWEIHQLFVSGTPGDEIRNVAILGLQGKNLLVYIVSADNVELDVSIDNSETTANTEEDGDPNVGVELYSFDRVTGTVKVTGGWVGLSLQNSYPLADKRAARSEITPYLYDQKLTGIGGALENTGTMDVVLQGGRISGTSGVSNANWTGAFMLTGMKAIGVSVDWDGDDAAWLAAGGAAFSGGSAATDRRSCCVNGVFE